MVYRISLVLGPALLLISKTCPKFERAETLQNNDD